MAGTWERRGTVTVTRDSKIVTGVGTYWTDAKNGPQIGNTFYGPDGQAHEVALIKSATELWLADEYKGVTESGVKYQIDTTRVDSVPGLASRVAAALGYAQGQYDNIDKWTHGGVDEDVTLTSPNGESVTVPSLPKMARDYTVVGAALPAAERAEAATVRAEAAGSATAADLADVTIKAGQADSSANIAIDAKVTAVAAADTATQKAASAATHDASAKDAATRAENAAAAVVGAVLDGGECDLSTGVYPLPITVAGKKYSTIWYVAVAGSVSGVAFDVGDLLRYTTAKTGYYFKVDAKDDVYSVNGDKGAVVITPEKIGAEKTGVAQQLVEQHTSKPGAHGISSVQGLAEALAGKETAGAAVSAITAHEAKEKAHTISGVEGLREELDGIKAAGGDAVLDVKWLSKRSPMRMGYTAGDGQTLPRAVYPDAFAAIQAGLVPVCTDAEWVADPGKRGCFTLGDGSTTFRIPDYNGVQPGSYGPVYFGGGSAASGAILRDRIQNITAGGLYGGVGTGRGALAADVANLSGALKKTRLPDGAVTQNASGNYERYEIGIDASLVARTGDTTRPITAEGCMAIKLFGAVQNAGSADAAALATAVAELAARVSVLEQRKHTTLIPVTFPSGAPHDKHETIVSQLPANVEANRRYVLPNPFGVNTRVSAVLELYVNGRWAEPKMDGLSGSGIAAYGAYATYVQGEGIVIQTGSTAVLVVSNQTGGGHGYTGASLTSAPCRVFVCKLEA